MKHIQAIKREAIIRDGRVLQTGENVELLKHRGPRTEVVGLRGMLVLTGLMVSR